MSIECKAITNKADQAVALVTSNEIEKKTAVLDKGEVKFIIVQRLLQNGKILVASTDAKTGYTQEVIVEEKIQ